MKTSVVNLSSIGTDWRASKHTPATDEELKQAKQAGADCGLRGSKGKCTSIWTKHGNAEVEKAFWTAHALGVEAREKCLRKAHKPPEYALVYLLTMPQNNAWNGKWTGDEEVYAKIAHYGRNKKTRAKSEEIMAAGPYRYAFGDGWVAQISVQKYEASEALKIMDKSQGFAGYDWMVDSIIQYGDVKSLEDRMKEDNNASTRQ